MLWSTLQAVADRGKHQVRSELGACKDQILRVPQVRALVSVQDRFDGFRVGREDGVVADFAGEQEFTTWDGEPVSRERPHGATVVVASRAPQGWRYAYLLTGDRYAAEDAAQAALGADVRRVVPGTS